MPHTPGPWQYFAGTHSIHGVVARKGSSAICVVSGPMSWRGESLRHVEREANASLIAAAPELLDALKAVLAIASANAEDTEGGETDADCERARTVIAKAEAPL